MGDFLLKLFLKFSLSPLLAVASPYEIDEESEDVELDEENDKTDRSAMTEDAEAHEAPDEGVDE
jgi:hypothetical protein